MAIRFQRKYGRQPLLVRLPAVLAQAEHLQRVPFNGEAVLVGDAFQPAFGRRFNFHGFAAVRTDEVMMVPVIAAQAEQLLPVETDRVGAAGFSQGVELPVDRGESDMFATVFQLAVQLLRGDEFVIGFYGKDLAEAEMNSSQPFSASRMASFWRVCRTICSLITYDVRLSSSRPSSRWPQGRPRFWRCRRSAR